ncbi:DegQ family serine endoprotease [Salinarimonas ramus]|uniref:Probable periplasmic serine endoprotease DegP-like n=1 Tax=Salinarimonas ramus TaxID=690164 RepID=A0A917V7G4_9HYPH|nr:DegQ family serine endoprotease [Salinarimonas ramus]GGK46501.1 serine protease [Salinarimonas ramus]
MPEAVSQLAARATRRLRVRGATLALAAALAMSPLGAPLAQTAPVAPAQQITPTPFPDAPESFADLVDRVMPAVVNIQAATTAEVEERFMPQLPPGTPFEDLFEEFFNRRGEGAPRMPRRSNSLGSGFIIDPSGIVVTNNHVIGDADEIEVVFADGTTYDAEVIGTDSAIDIAVLKIESDVPFPSVPFGDSEEMRIGDWVVAIGNPFGLGGSVSAGIVSARARDIASGPYDNYIQTDAAINRGNSGGPLFNMRGEVVGINTAILSPTGGSVGIGFSIPTSTALPVIEQLQEFGETRRGWLGVRIQSVDETTADALGLDEARGALVAGVDPDGPASAAGIEMGDVIVSFDGVEVESSRDLPRIVANTPVGKEVAVEVVRDGEPVTIDVTIARLQETAEAADVTGPTEEDAPVAVREALGMELSEITEELRARFSIADDVEGVVVTEVDPLSAASERRIQPGNVILEVGQEPVASPAEVAERLQELRAEGRRSALLLVSDADGEVRFVALGMNDENADDTGNGGDRN